MEFTDQLGNIIRLERYPQRIISLVPSLTELLYHLSLNEEVVGITKFCIHPPEWFSTKTRVGGTKKLHFDTIHRLQPDLIIANKEENNREDIEQLSRQYPVLVTDIARLPQALAANELIGRVTNRSAQANRLNIKITQAFDHLPFPETYLDVLYLIWKNPYMSVGHDTFIHDMLECTGCRNVLEEQSRYPVLSAEDMIRLNPQVVFLSSEPFPFKEKHIAEVEAILPHAHIELVDGEMFSWYGARLLYAPAYFRGLQERLTLL